MKLQNTPKNRHLKFVNNKNLTNKFTASISKIIFETTTFLKVKVVQAINLKVLTPALHSNFVLVKIGLNDVLKEETSLFSPDMEVFDDRKSTIK